MTLKKTELDAAEHIRKYVVWKNALIAVLCFELFIFPLWGWGEQA